MDKQNFEKDINVPSKRLDRIDKMEIDLANYEQMERDIEKIIEPYQLDWELDCLSLPNAIQSILERKEQELQEAMDNYVKLDNQRVKEYNELVDRYTAKEQECEELKRRITKIFACLIKANRNEIVDTLWVDDITTLWDYIASTLEIEGDQTQIEEQILQKISDLEV